MTDLEALDIEINHLADIMDVGELATEAMKYCAAIGVWVHKNIEKLDADEDKALITMATIESAEDIKTAVRNIHIANIHIKSCFMALEMAKEWQKEENDDRCNIRKDQVQRY